MYTEKDKKCLVQNNNGILFYLMPSKIAGKL